MITSTLGLLPTGSKTLVNGVASAMCWLRGMYKYADTYVQNGDCKSA